MARILPVCHGPAGSVVTASMAKMPRVGDYDPNVVHLAPWPPNAGLASGGVADRRRLRTEGAYGAYGAQPRRTR